MLVLVSLSEVCTKEMDDYKMQCILEHLTFRVEISGGFRKSRRGVLREYNIYMHMQSVRAKFDNAH